MRRTCLMASIETVTITSGRPSGSRRLGGLRSRRSLAAVVAFLAAVALGIAGAIAYYLPSGHDSIASLGPPPISLSPTGSAPIPGQPAGDTTVPFHDFAMVGQKFEPEWLIRVKRVYWTEIGALWADATMPTNSHERAFVVEKICQKLSEYVTNGAKRDWRGVSVRTVDGAELITRANPTDTCRLAG
jgi:hypothetical protein